MDIVSVQGGQAKSRNSQRRLSERRHTTEVRYDQLPSHTLSELERDSITSLSTEDLSPRGDDYHHPVAGYSHLVPGIVDSSHLSNHQHYKAPLNSSWANVSSAHSSNDADYCFQGSQGDLYQEIDELSRLQMKQKDPMGHQYQLSYELALDNILTPFAPAPVISPLAVSKVIKQSHVSHVIEEMVSTEMTYVHDLSEVIEGYYMPLQIRTQVLPLTQDHLRKIFGNITEVRDFHSSLLRQLNDMNGSVSKLGQCFLDKAEGFKNIYTQYCNNYPKSINVLSELSKVTTISNFLKTCQQRLNHLLPLGAYLLKPVQRVLKYYLLLSEMVKSVRSSVDGYPLIREAMGKMMEVAEHVNAMKRKYDTAVHVQEIQSLIRGQEMQKLDLTKYGDLVLDDSFRFSSGRRGRRDSYVFLFQRLFLVTKKDEDGYQYKMHVEMKDLQLTERVEKEPTCFQIRQVSSGRASTFQSRTVHHKEEWVQKIKVLLVESIPHLPDKARELIMRGFEVPRDSSPSRERHRRYLTTDESIIGVGGVSGRSHTEPPVTRKSNSLGRSITPQTMEQHMQLHHVSGNRSRTRNQKSPTPLKLQGSLTGFLVSSVHQPRGDSPPPDGDDVVEEMSGRGISHPFPIPSEQRDSGYSDTVTGDGHKQPRVEEIEEVPRAERTGLLLSSDKRTNTLLPGDSLGREILSEESDTYLDTSHTPSPPPSTNAPASKKPPIVDHVTNQHASLNLPQDESTTTSPAHMDDHNPTHMDDHTHYNGSDTLELEEDETLFNELMSSSSEASLKKAKYSYTDLDWGNRSLDSDLAPNGKKLSNSSPTLSSRVSQQEGDSNGTVEPHLVPEGRSSRGNSIDDEASTPRASPYTSPANIRRWSVRKRRSYDSNDPDESITPMASPYVRRNKSAIVHGTSPNINHNSDHVLTSPVLEPPTPFRSPAVHEPLQSHPEELESSLSSGQNKSVTRPAISQDTEISKSDSDIIEFTPDMSVVGPDDVTITPSDNTLKAKTLPPDAELSSDSIPVAMPLKTDSSPVRRSQSFSSNSKLRILQPHHLREGSLSTDNSPLPSPIFKSKKNKTKDSKLRPQSGSKRHHSPLNRSSPAPPVAVVGLVGTTRTEPNLQDLPLVHVDSSREGTPTLMASGEGGSIILPPPVEFEGSPDIVDPSGNNVEPPITKYGDEDPPRGEGSEDRSILSFLRIRTKRGSRSSTPGSEASPLNDRRLEHDEVNSPVVQTPTTPLTPLAAPLPEPSPVAKTMATPILTPAETNPSDMYSFDEMLQSYDRYANETGKTARSKRLKAEEQTILLNSPDIQRKKEKKKKKKKKRHGHTVALIDSETLKEVRKMTEEDQEGNKPSRKSSDSKVHQLAREYSQRIKERTKYFKRTSTIVVEEPTTPEPTESVKPDWLMQLKEKRRVRSASVEDSLDRVGEEETTSSSSTVASSDNLATSTTEPHPPVSNQVEIEVEGVTTQKTEKDVKRHAHTLGRVGGDMWLADGDNQDLEDVGKEGEGRHKVGRLKGWVRSFAAKFGKKEGTTL